jgi:hypothetical protein
LQTHHRFYFSFILLIIIMSRQIAHYEQEIEKEEHAMQEVPSA